MNGIVSILHISDLHRSRKDQISNTALLSSLISDREKYTNEEHRLIKSADLIVVSGDIIRGSTNETNSEIEIKEQYSEAEALLCSLCDRFLGGDRSRIVIIPGNHDMDWKYSKSSMTKMDKHKVFNKNSVNPSIFEEIVKSNSSIRFSWKDLTCYEITNRSMYEERIGAFANFYNSFYQGFRTYSLKPEEQFHIYDYEEFNITIVGFNSCLGNDHLRLAGDIHHECIANSNTELIEYKRKGRLIIATWHHNTKGGVYDMNFMDSGKLKNFIDAGISIGLHGHQHKTELIYEYSNALEQKKIVVFSSGTLCGGRPELPTGMNRQYNIIEIDTMNDEKIEVTLHVREKTESSSSQNPVWQRGRIPDTLESCITVKIEKPKVPPTAVSLLQVEKLLREKKFDDASYILKRLDINESLVRFYWLQLIGQTENAKLAFEIFLPPQSTPECLTVLGFAISDGNHEIRRKCLEAGTKFNEAGDPSINQLIKKLEALIK